MTWLEATHQRWKLVVLVSCAVVTLGFFGWFIRQVNAASGVRTAFATFAISVVFMVNWLLLAIRCPVCGYRPTLHLMRTEQFDNWFVRLVSLERCRRCAGKDDEPQV